MPNKPTVVRTNSTPNSFGVVQLRAVTFQELWDNYPNGNPYDNPAYDNQCAIRLSVTLHRVGIGMKSFSQKIIRPMNGDKIGRILLDGKATATRADEMGQWLKSQPFAGLPKAEDVTGADWEAKVRGRTGIIEFSRYWTRDGERAENASGGHIDLWNGRKLTSPSFEGGINTFMRFTLGISSAWYSDLGKSKQILFWEIK
ncbi:type VI secretion system amidase effector protein Tae4 [Caballeronia sp. LZ019]|uniref:type VI secretion system amidase effector protein Tae4 n=1 Tax=Caballeronia sp. LZ019 TaxID=3038555 RepID=UPI0028609E20|nr:type VI secretion system amidase effector protein Tae4 [Caballeronia sp. LZ019]MDR5809402.1 type VI secretion system amidase effector protein Tae4 [Caballeronia sp. LZ019]